ncbi:MAG: diaminopimelate epimerase [Bacteroidota bacterium]
MQLKFYKYQGAGNDFVLIDNRKNTFKKDTKTISFLCNRRFGIGADGLILLEKDERSSVDFKMIYYNSDGNESTMCGNGGRCIVAFAQHLGIISAQTTFSAIDGLHQASINLYGEVRLQMQNVSEIKIYQDHSFFLDTGSPHHVEFVAAVNDVDVFQKGKSIRESQLYGKAGTNVNFAEIKENSIRIRTYERGVENETLACGTGVTAVAIAAHKSGKLKNNEIPVQAKGGDLKVDFKVNSETHSYENIFLTGPAKMAFKGDILC